MARIPPSQIQSQRHQNKFEHDSFLYVKDKMSADGTIVFWRCDKRGIGCNGRIWTNANDGTFNSLRIRHTCSEVGNAARVQLQTMQTRIKQRAETTMENPSTIRDESLANAPLAVLGQAPTTNAVRLMTSRARRGVAPAANPGSREEIVIPPEYRTYEATPAVFEEFLLADSGPEEERILVFGRASHRNWSAQMREVFVDGTFVLAPPLFTQIFVILSRRGDFVFPVLFTLLPNKRKETYVKLFRLLREMWPDFSPDSVSVDFELAIHQALREVFAECQINGCFFHLVSNLKKHISNSHLLGRYNNDPEFALRARMITAVAFVPEQDITAALGHLEQNFLEMYPELEGIMEWFSNTYVGRLRNNGTRAAPTFPFATWSVLQRTLDGADRTNNYAEATNKKLKVGFGVSHPTIWKFIDGLRKLQKGLEFFCGIFLIFLNL
jgi:hypothetical protein